MSDLENTVPPVESSNDVCSAAEALKRAKAEFEKAKDYYEKVRQQAVERVKAVRETSIGDMLDGTLETVRRHPGAGLTIAAMIGFLIGRLFRR